MYVDVSPAPTISGDSQFVTFASKSFIIPYVEGTNTSIVLEAPCTKTVTSSLNYQIDSLPDWLHYNPSSASSTQTITSNATLTFLTSDFREFNGSLTNSLTYNGLTLNRDFTVILFRCPDSACLECLSFNSTAGRGICTSCDSNSTLLNERCDLNCGNGILNPNEQCDDLNLVSGDGCSKECKVEEGWACEGVSC